MAQMSSILFGDTMVPKKEEDYILLLGYSTLHKEHYLTRFSHQKNTTQKYCVLSLLRRHAAKIVRALTWLT